MKGLLIKDFKLMMMQKNFFLSIIAIAVVLTVFVKNPSFIIGCLTFIGSVFTLSTISYDEFDNGNAFLFSLPITRKLYALEKYVFGFLTGACSCLISLILCMIFGLIFGNYSISDSLMTAGMSFPMFLFLLLLMLPVHLKFGSEKGKIAILGVLGAVFIVGFLFVKLDQLLGLGIIASLNSMSDLGIGGLIAAMFAIVAVLFLISYRISSKIMEKKEF